MKQPGEIISVDASRLGFVWPAALACFLLAALTGVLYRYGLGYGETFGFSLVNIRHAHSHLMYFGWATPVLMAMMTVLRIPRGRRRGVPSVLWLVFAGAALSYPLFLLFGYSLIQIGSAELPIAVIGSSLNMLAWYGFAFIYVRETRGLERDRTGILFDLALLFLVLASLGAWALALLQPLGIQSEVWTSALTHIFLDLFSEGWFVLGTLGALYALVPRDEDRRAHWSFALICAGLPLTFAMGMPSVYVVDGLETLAHFGTLLVGIGLLVNVAILARRMARASWLMWVPLVFLAVKSAGQVAEALTPAFSITALPGMRLLYLHLMLLGFVSTGLVVASAHLDRPAPTRAAVLFFGAIGLMIASLIMFTPAMPTDWLGSWIFRSAFWVALLPIPGAAWLLWAGIQRRPQPAHFTRY